MKKSTATFAPTVPNEIMRISADIRMVPSLIKNHVLI